MEEKNNSAVGSGDEAAVKSKSRLWFENFWYHYKWHTIVAVFLLIAVTVLSVQMCTRTTYDIHITYAGNYEIKRSGIDVSSPYSEAVKSLNRLTEDFDGDGEVNVNFVNLFVVNEKEKEEILGGNKNLEINDALVKEDTDTLKTSIVYGEHYIFLLSQRLFLEYEEAYEGELFISLEGYSQNGKDYEYVSSSKTGIYLRSLGISGLPTLADLPEDTVVCMRKLSPVSSVFGKKENEENFKRSEAVIKNILSFE